MCVGIIIEILTLSFNSDDALNLMQQRRFWKRFDPEVLDLYVVSHDDFLPLMPYVCLIIYFVALRHVQKGGWKSDVKMSKGARNSKYF